MAPARPVPEESKIANIERFQIKAVAKHCCKSFTAELFPNLFKHLLRGYQDKSNVFYNADTIPTTVCTTCCQKRETMPSVPF